MKKTKFSEERIAYILRQAEGGTSAVEVCRQNGISEQTFYRWKKRYGGMGVAELRRLRQCANSKKKIANLSSLWPT